MIPPRAYVWIALAASLAGNAFLFWQWAQAKPECAAKTLSGDLKQERKGRQEDDRRDLQSAATTAATDRDAAQAAAQADSAVLADKKDIRDAYRQPLPPDPAPRDSACVRVAPVPDGVQHAIERAVFRSNSQAAAGELQEAGNAAGPSAAEPR